ncbi:MAG: DegQ family serine endoprotease, partial [Burkholderiales bacterium]|nr:DegQ family serine endoprotease [Burkholderiales bacterium]
LWSPAMPAQAQGRELPDFAELADKWSPSVVNIRTLERGRVPSTGEVDPSVEEFFRRFGIPMPGRPDPRRGPRGDNDEPQQRGVGSGFILSPDGFVMTNAHVVDGADEVMVTLTDKREFKARIIGHDKRTDVAVVKIEANALPAVKIGDVNKLRVGEWVMAIGSPFGLDNTVTAGIVSAKGRSLPQENFTPFIQTDVAINPGNSGGPLFNLKGEVVGINSQIYSRTGGFMGLSFAIPIDVALDISNQLKTTGKVTRGRIGVVIQEVTKDLAESFGLPKPQGALVNSVEKGGAADKGGIETSDIILKFDGKTVGSSSDLPRIVAATRPGTKVPVQVWRKGANKELTITVGELQDDKRAEQSRAKPPAKAGGAVARLGLTLTELSAEQRKELGVNSGLLVEEAQGNATRAGIRKGDVLLAINNQDVKTVEQVNQVVAQFEKSRSVALLIRRGDASIYVPLKLNGN